MLEPWKELKQRRATATETQKYDDSFNVSLIKTNNGVARAARIIVNFLGFDKTTTR